MHLRTLLKADNMNILDAIVEHKRVEILKRKQKRPLSSLSAFPHYRRKTNEIDQTLLTQKPGIIAEFKRKSPSKGAINLEADPVEVAGGYARSGVAAMSILTDRNFFGGSFADMRQVREAHPGLTLLRKDFIIDPYQLHEASAYGADLVLLIAAILSKNQVAELAEEAGSLGLQILFEVHDRNDLECYHDSIRYVGVNNRDLKTFRVDTGRSLSLLGDMPDGVIPVSESGFHTTKDIRSLWDAGYRLFLIGEAFMREKDPGKACELFLEHL